jgi:lipopolysaccharide export system protein LptC
MTVAPLPSRDRLGLRRPVPARRISRPVASAIMRQMARRRWLVAFAKRLLPIVALALLASVALWPEIARDSERARLSYRRGIAPPESGQMTAATYHGVDSGGRPYTITAAQAQQVNPERINLTEPKGDISLESGSWLMAQSHQGVYLQHLNSLDLSDEVHLYRDDGTTLTTSSASLDLKLGAAAGAEMVHAEGPFGTLDAQGFAVTDRGAVLQFSGPGRLVLNSARGQPAQIPEQDESFEASEPPVPPRLQ